MQAQTPQAVQPPPYGVVADAEGLRPSRVPWRLEGRYEPVGCVVGFWSRVAASAVDKLILLGPIAVLDLLFAGSILGLAESLAPARAVASVASARLVLFVVPAVLVALYSTLLIGGRGATVGMAWVGLRVIREDEQPLGYGLALARWALCQLPGMIPYLGVLWVLNPLCVSWDQKKQAIHDSICRTLVIASRPRNSFAHVFGLVLLVLPFVLVPLVLLWLSVRLATMGLPRPWRV